MLDSRDMGMNTRGRTDTDDGDCYSAEKHAWTASAEERATYARGPAMRGMRQAPRTLLGGPAVAASTQSDQGRSAAYHSHELATKDHQRSPPSLPPIGSEAGFASGIIDVVSVPLPTSLVPTRGGAQGCSPIVPKMRICSGCSSLSVAYTNLNVVRKDTMVPETP